MGWCASLDSSSAWDGKEALFSLHSVCILLKRGDTFVCVCVWERETGRKTGIFLHTCMHLPTYGTPKGHAHCYERGTWENLSWGKQVSWMRPVPQRKHTHTYTRTHTPVHTSTYIQYKWAQTPCCAQLFSNIENLQNIEFGIFVRSPRFSIIQNKKYKKTSWDPCPPSPVASWFACGSLTRIQLA